MESRAAAEAESTVALGRRVAAANDGCGTRGRARPGLRLLGTRDALVREFQGLDSDLRAIADEMRSFPPRRPRPHEVPPYSGGAVLIEQGDGSLPQLDLAGRRIVKPVL